MVKTGKSKAGQNIKKVMDKLKNRIEGFRDLLVKKIEKIENETYNHIKVLENKYTIDFPTTGKVTNQTMSTLLRIIKKEKEPSWI
jgi:uncharacterized protein (DUF2344 family)